MELLKQNQNLIFGVVGAAAIIVLFQKFFKKSKPERKRGVVFLHSLPAGWSLPSTSPFCGKLEYYLRYHKIPFEVIIDFDSGPKGKWPFIELNGEIMGDSTLIINKLNKEFNVNLDLDLTKEQKSISSAFQSLIEEHAYFVLVYLRWSVHWKVTKAVYFQKMPWIIRHIIPEYVIKPTVMKNLRAQGMGRHSEEEIIEMGLKDYQAVSDYLGDKQFFFGSKISSIDIIIFTFVESVSDIPLENKLKAELLKMPNLMAHKERVRSAINSKK